MSQGTGISIKIKEECLMSEKTPSKNLPGVVKKSNKYNETSEEFITDESINKEEKNSSTSDTRKFAAHDDTGANSANNTNNVKYNPNTYNK
jgi:hypothetical protein